MKAALLGLQHPHSMPHLRTLQAVPDVSEILLWDEDTATVDRVRSENGHKVIGVSTDLETLLAEDDLTFVLVALPNDQNCEVCLRALDHGKHVLAEKPIGTSAQETARVVDTAKAAGLQLAVCYQNRRHPLILEARTFVRQGLLGELMSVNMQLLTTQVQFRNPSHWLFQQERSGGGMLSWLGCHYVDLMRYITGEEITAVTAQVATRSGESIDVEDVAVLGVRFGSGAIGSLHVGYTLAQGGSGYENRQGYATLGNFNGRLGRVAWSGATIPPARLLAESAHPDWAGAPRREFDFVPSESKAYGGAHGEQFLSDFIASTTGDGSPPASGEDALRVARIVDAAYLSSTTGQTITFSL